MKIKIMVVIFFLITSWIYTDIEVSAKSCDYSWQTAKNGSRCGARAKSARKSSSYAR